MHTSLDSIVNLSVNWSIYSLYVDFWPKKYYVQVRCGCLIESNKHIGNNSTAGLAMEVTVLCRDNM